MVSRSKRRDAWGDKYRYKGEKPDPQRERPTPALPVTRKRKDTKRWCRGKEGVEHVTRIEQWKGTECRVWASPTSIRDPLPICFEQEICERCHKILRYHLGKDCKLVKRRTIEDAPKA